MNSENLISGFSKEHLDFCIRHIERRNSEIHTGELIFASLGTSEWLPSFYSTCKVLLESMNRELPDLVSDPAAAQNLIDSLRDAASKAVEQDIKAHKLVWSNKDSKEQDEASSQADVWTTRRAGHRVDCPSCNSCSLLQGEPSGRVTTEVNGDVVVERQTLSPSSFECIACGLRISGFSKLSACGLGNAFSAKSTYTAAEFFGLSTQRMNWRTLVTSRRRTRMTLTNRFRSPLGAEENKSAPFFQ